MNVVHVAFECAPIYKTGGLGDVVGSLPKVQAEQGIEAAVILPAYGWIKQLPFLPHSRVPVFYAPSHWFSKPNTAHDPKISAPTYAHFALTALDELKRQNIKPDIIHCHDWHTALIPFLLKNRPDAFFESTKTLLTLHNIAYQGNFPLSYLDLAETKVIVDTLRKQQKRISFLKTGIETADFVSTVSPHHAQEIRARKVGFGLTQAIRHKRGKFVGIVNGLDLSVWDPRTDPLIHIHYNRTTVISGKAENKLQLQKQLGLAIGEAIPLLGFIARLTEQKGIELLLSLLKELPEQRIQLVILGTGEKRYETALKKFMTKVYHDWISINFAFDEKLAHQIYAGADFFLIPSHYEPCGLTQMISSVYGTIPIASKVGGLIDTIENGKTGFLFSELTATTLHKTIEQALTIWQDKSALKKFIGHAMRKDFSWKKSSREYVKLYHKIINAK